MIKTSPSGTSLLGFSSLSLKVLVAHRGQACLCAVGVLVIYMFEIPPAIECSFAFRDPIFEFGMLVEAKPRCSQLI